MVRVIPQTIARHVYKVEAAVLLQPLDRLVYQILPVGEAELSEVGVKCEWNYSFLPQPDHQMILKILLNGEISAIITCRCRWW